METSSTSTDDKQERTGAASGTKGNLPRVVLIISLSLNVFVFASLAMYGVWLVASPLSDFWRGVTALLVWIATFGAGALVFWKIVAGISASSAGQGS
jgi:hypothetical protein